MSSQGQYSQAAVFVACVVLFAITVAIHVRECDLTTAPISNEDVSWDGDFFGLQPTLSLTGEKLVQQANARERKWLINNLSDPKRFAACHVVLALAHKMPKLGDDVNEWHGLVIALQSDGTVHYPHAAEQMRRLKAYWEARTSE